MTKSGMTKGNSGVVSDRDIPTLSVKYPTYRNEFYKSGKRWLDGKRIDDNAEGLWRVHDKLYDLTDFINRHPGGSQWLQMTKGLDITEQFETHHITTKAEMMLEKFYVRDAVAPRNYKYTYEENGFYKTLKRRVRDQLSGLDQVPVKLSKIISDMMLGLTLVSAVLATKDDNIYIAMLSGVFLLWLTIVAHNFFHQKDNWRMYCFNLSLMNAREWRISHAMSHHLYTNSFHDLEISMFEPFLQWMPKRKSKLVKIASTIISPFVYTILFAFVYIQKIVACLMRREKFQWDDLIPLVLPVMMYYLGKPDLLLVLKLWMTIVGFSSFLFGFVGLNAGHHEPTNLHEGDEIRSLDFGIFQMDSVIDRKDLKGNQFMVLTNFGEHTLHHLFPSLDHGLLPQLNSIFLETCNEFKTELREYPWYKLIIGQFQQLTRTKVRKLVKATN